MVVVVRAEQLKPDVSWKAQVKSGPPRGVMKQKGKEGIDRLRAAGLRRTTKRAELQVY